MLWIVMTSLCAMSQSHRRARAGGCACEFRSAAIYVRCNPDVVAAHVDRCGVSRASAGRRAARPSRTGSGD